MRLYLISAPIDVSPSLEAGAGQGETDHVPLTEAALRLGCHVETLRLRVRRGQLTATRGPHGRYYVRVADLERMGRPRRMRRRRLDGDPLESVRARIEALLADPRRLMGWQRELVAAVGDDRRVDLPLFRVMAARSLSADGYNTREIAQLLGISVRHVHRLRSADLMVTLARSWRRRKRAEAGRLRRDARSIVADLQRRLAAAGFRPARRAFLRRGSEGTIAGAHTVPGRLALVTWLTVDQRRDLLRVGLDPKEIDAILLVGIGADELHELLVNGAG